MTFNLQAGVRIFSVFVGLSLSNCVTLSLSGFQVSRVFSSFSSVQCSCSNCKLCSTFIQVWFRLSVQFYYFSLSSLNLIISISMIKKVNTALDCFCSEYESVDWI